MCVCVCVCVCVCACGSQPYGDKLAVAARQRCTGAFRGLNTNHQLLHGRHSTLTACMIAAYTYVMPWSKTRHIGCPPLPTSGLAVADRRRCVMPASSFSCDNTAHHVYCDTNVDADKSSAHQSEVNVLYVLLSSSPVTVFWDGGWATVHPVFDVFSSSWNYAAAGIVAGCDRASLQDAIEHRCKMRSSIIAGCDRASLQDAIEHHCKMQSSIVAGCDRGGSFLFKWPT